MQIFGSPMYSGLMIDQSLTLNRRRDGEYEMNYNDIMEEVQNDRMDK
jgi:hypothetical protein